MPAWYWLPLAWLSTALWFSGYGVFISEVYFLKLTSGWTEFINPIHQSVSPHWWAEAIIFKIIIERCLLSLTIFGCFQILFLSVLWCVDLLVWPTFLVLLGDLNVQPLEGPVFNTIRKEKINRLGQGLLFLSPQQWILWWKLYLAFSLTWYLSSSLTFQEFFHFLVNCQSSSSASFFGMESNFSSCGSLLNGSEGTSSPFSYPEVPPP